MFIMPHANILNYQGVRPQLGDDVFVASGAQLIGDLIIGAQSSIWFNVVIRADCHSIRIGERTNIQDNTTIHVTAGTAPVHIGSDVTIGHGAIVHGCRIENLALIGMGAIILDGAVIPERSLVAAGSLVSPGKTFPPGMLIKGSPAVAVRPLNDREIAALSESVQHYLEYAAGFARSASL